MKALQNRVVWFVLIAGWGMGIAGAATVDGRIAYLQMKSAKTSPTFAGSLRFVCAPHGDQLAELAELGVIFADHHSRTIYPARIPFASLDALSARPDVLRVECAWRPGGAPTLARSVPQVEADLVWAMPAGERGSVTGMGVLVADLDTGVNYRHTVFMNLTGERYEWLDGGHNVGFADDDAVDLNRNGVADPGESLRHREALGTSSYGNVLGPYDTGLDFLFNDANGDQVHNGDPHPGEPMFVCDDSNTNGILDEGESLLALDGTRIRAIRDLDGTVYRRGVDLFAAPGDSWGHGTQVSGIVCGGWAGHYRMTGVAPGAEMLMVMMDYAPEPPFLLPVESGLAWAVAEGADVVLMEDGEWIWEYLDGSSNFEVMISEYAADDGVIFVAPVGNLATGHMHSRFRTSAAQGLLVEESTEVIWISLLWRDPVALTLDVAPPGGAAVGVPLDGTTIERNGYRIYSNLSVSQRGTRRLDLRFGRQNRSEAIGGTWRMTFGGPAREVHGYFSDDFGWVSPSRWLLGEESGYTVTWPATADSTIGVAAYQTQGDGPINLYSGRGPRLDGSARVDIAAPGSWVSSADPENSAGFIGFGGTSSAGAHVAGAAALLKELDPGLDHARCRQYLRAGAGRDEYTGDLHAAGSGKLRIHRAVAALLEGMSETPLTARPAVTAYPNPFNAHTMIRFRQLAQGPAQVRIFDMAGHEVWAEGVGAGNVGWCEVSWNGRDAQGRALPSGVYFAHLRQGGQTRAGKVTLVR